MTAKQNFINTIAQGKIDKKISFLDFLNIAHIITFSFVAVFVNLGILTI